jgi:hypothetical protein
MDSVMRKMKIGRITLLGTMVILAALVLGSCAPAPTPALPSAGEGVTPTARSPEDSTAAAQPNPELPAGALPAAEALAKQLGIEVDSVGVVSVQEVEWPDACLGVSTPGVMCAQVITPGYRVVLEARGQRYEYHTNVDGTQVKPAKAESQGQTEPVLTWHREGGIAGFCDDLLVYASGDAQAGTCKGGTAKPLAQARLQPEDRAKLEEWANRLASFEYVQTDPAKADAMTIRVIFTGRGKAAATDADKQEIQAWAAQVFVKMSAQQ